ncbi:MAG: hypothetical protein ED557_15355 [Balneola sp.]|nr:MAG: hypothetical protein ED557_15355 [Balneola sp.]
MKELKIHESGTFIVDSQKVDNRSCFWLSKHGVYRIEVDPKDQKWTDGKLFSQTVSADGFSNIFLNLFSWKKRYRGAKWFTLMGKIKGEKNSDFPIGALEPNYSPGDHGELICYANDAYGHYKNNSDSINVRITRIS